MANLDDDDFLNAGPPVTVEDKDPVVTETPTVEQEVVVPEPTQKTEVITEKENNTGQESEKIAEEPTIKLPGEQQEESDETSVVIKETEAKKEEPVIDYAAFYAEMMAPLNANGKSIEIKSPEDVKQLMRMGANYTRKMQDMAPHRKILAMLENNGLLSEEKLSYYIDLEKKNPEAIKKLIKDSGLDPLEIDVTIEPNYQRGNHQVSDDEVRFRSILDDVKSSNGGQETLKVINDTWDQVSKEELWKAPEVLSVIQEQRENGIYDRITTEINRQTMLGAIPSGTPFVQAYMKIGNELGAKGAFADIAAKSSKAQPSAESFSRVTPPSPVPVATRVVAPKPIVTNSAAASAASSSRGVPKRIAPIANLQGLGDEDFLKTWANRL